MRPRTPDEKLALELALEILRMLNGRHPPDITAAAIHIALAVVVDTSEIRDEWHAESWPFCQRLSRHLLMIPRISRLN